MDGMTLALDAHLAGLEAAAERMATWAAQAGPGAAVPTCPDWAVRDLLAHQGGVHRWATAMLRGGDPAGPGIDDLAAGAPGDAGIVDWLRAGAQDLLATLRTVPEDVDAFTFLHDPPPPRLFWARRQHHETAMHALDALAAREIRRPRADDVWFGPEVSLDAVDELLAGFWPRRTKGPRSEQAYHAVVVTGGRRWRLDLGPDAPVTTRLGPDDPSPEGALVLSGDPAEVHLGLWNRGGSPTDPDGLLGRWRSAGIR